MRLVLRPVLSFVVLVALAIAVLQVFGRGAVALLGYAEPAVNQLLIKRGIGVRGLDGAWRGLNPVLRVQRVVLPAGHVDDVYVELDLIKTLALGRPVLFRARVADAALRLEKRGAGPWGLAGMPRGQGFDPIPWLTETDQLELDGQLTFARFPAPATVGANPSGSDAGGTVVEAALAASYTGVNRDGRGRHSVTLRNLGGDCAAPCQLRLELARDSAWVLNDADTAFQLEGERFVLPKALLGGGRVTLDQIELAWNGIAPAALGGHGAAALHGTVGRNDVPFALDLAGAARGDGEQAWGELHTVNLTQGDHTLVLAPIRVRMEDDAVHAAVPALQLDAIADVLRGVLASNEVASRWLSALALEGQVAGLRLRVPFDSPVLGYRFDLEQFAMDGHRGVPWVRNGRGRVYGATPLLTGRPQSEVGNVIELALDGADLAVAFPDHLRDSFAVDSAAGVLQAFVRRDEIAVRAADLSVRFDGVSARGSLGISRLGKDERDRRLAAVVAVDHIDVPTARRLVPVTLPPRLFEFLTGAPMSGTLVDAQLAYQGQFRTTSAERGRRLEIAGGVRDGSLRFHPLWPPVERVNGRLEVAGREVRAAATAGRSMGAVIDGSRVRLRDNGGVADVELVARLNADAGLALVRASPLARWLPFVEPDWQGRGGLSLQGTLRVPLRTQQPATATDPPPTTEQLAVSMEATLEGVELDMPGYRLAFSALRGPVRYAYPDVLNSPGLSGTLFDAPVRVTARSASGRFLLDVAGTAGAANVWSVIGWRDLGLLRGAARFDARLDVAAPKPAAAASPTPDREPGLLTIRSDLAGMTLDLPGGYAKLPEESEALAVDLRLGTSARRLTFDYRDVAGWLVFAPDRSAAAAVHDPDPDPDPAPAAPADSAARVPSVLVRGSIGIGSPPMPVSRDSRELLVTGRVRRFATADWRAMTPAAEASSGLPADSNVRSDAAPPQWSLPPALPVPLRVRAFEVDALALGGFVSPNGMLEGDLTVDGLTVRFESDRLDAKVDWPASRQNGGLAVRVDDLWLPKGEGAGDPLRPDIIRNLPPATVDIRQMTVGDADFGNWRFRLDPVGDDLWLRELRGELRKVTITAGDGLVWRGATNRTAFEGALDMGNLAEVLPLWGYAPNVASKRAGVRGEVAWPGSPAAFSIQALTGTAKVSAESGRFLEVDAGGGTQRILSLLNFTTIAKRMSLDFSDVFGKGLSFDRLGATVGFETGTLRFVEPLEVEGTGLRLRMTGLVGLSDRTLDHEMIVTLPVNRSLPWYAAYLSLANPVAGLGVLVGERVLRKPLETFSSARYRVTGTVENPRVQLVSVFDTETRERKVDSLSEAEAPETPE